LVQAKVSCNCLYEAYKGMGNPTQALFFHERMTALDDSLKKDETVKKLQAMEFMKQMTLDSVKQEVEKVALRQANEEVVRKQNRTRNILLGVGGVLLLLLGGLYNRWRIIHKAKAVLEKEQERSEKLLLNILPADIAAELKATGKSEAREVEQVTMLFTDFRGFTEIASTLTARELVVEINACFEAFDGICATYGIEKIKTIGDAYMAAGGLSGNNPNAIQQTVLAALDMQAFMAARKTTKEQQGKLAFDMRAGLHTGPVVAGIVGLRKFQYDVWGDTVNTASRMESAGAVGKVNISNTTYELIKDDPRFTFEAREKINVKGKGEVQMWFVQKVMALPELAKGQRPTANS
jgi:adenylate cyclase